MFEIIKGKIPSAIKIVIYGAEGIGKSTFASKFPNPLYIDTEGSTKQLDISRLPSPESWNELLAEVKYVSDNKSLCRTLVIDTADWAEKLAVVKVCQDQNVKNIEDIGYGKGYVYLEQEFRNLLSLLDEVIKSGINVIIVAHSQIRTFYEVDNIGQYDRYELKLQKKTSPLLKEWADMLLFANYKTNIIIDQKTGKSKGVGGERVMYTTHTPVWDAKNRYDLDPELPFTYTAIAHLFNEEDLPFNIDEIERFTKESDKKDIRYTPLERFRIQLKSNNITEKEVIAWCKQNNIKVKKLEDIEESLLVHLNENFNKFKNKLNNKKEK